MSASINAPVAAAQTQTGAAAAPRIGADFNTFLSLLTTQLRNQDPTKAMDTQQMTAQLVQFAGVEQQLAVNQNLERLITLQQGSQLVSAAPLTGRVIEVESDRLTLQGGQATLRLPIASTAALAASVEVLDATGRVVRVEEATLGAAPRLWTWDGRDASGRLLADGAYATRVTLPGTATGNDPAGRTPLAFTVLGRATGAERVGGEVRLRLGGLDVPFDSLRGVVE
jgi:flagellar basal-body rod modification protein FlgD